MVSEFLKNIIKLKEVEITSAHRIGTTQEGNSGYTRPIIVKFPSLPHRNKVWRKRFNIPGEEGRNTIRIQADLPRQLRDDVRVLYRVLRAASAIPEYNTAVVRDFALVLNGTSFSPRELELLPQPIRPSYLATRTSDEAIGFFSRYTVFSNHFPAEFKVDDIKFSNVEQFLAYKRALMTDQQQVIQKALNASNPADAKSILNSLKEDHQVEWEANRATWAKEAIRAKFAQNLHLKEQLLKTADKQLGEASRDGVWGIGLDLDNPKVLDFANWPQSGNLLGKTLMAVREELK